MHGDVYSSDTTPLPGPGLKYLKTAVRDFLSACPTVLIRSDGRPFVLSTTILGQNPVVRLLNRNTGEQEASLQLEAGSLLGGVYAYIDNKDRMVMVDSSQHLVRIKAVKRGFLFVVWWELIIDESLNISADVQDHCGGNGCDSVVSINAGADGAVWFVTQHAMVGIYNPGSGTVNSMELAYGERVDNSFSTTMDGLAAIVTNKALYMLAQVNDIPIVMWRHEYDGGSARKPGQLSHGSGATPTFFGPRTGYEYVTITDNADGAISLIVRDSHSGALVCSKKIFTMAANSGTENSAIGLGNSVIISSTYGYPYPALPEGAENSVPESADFIGGMTRVDVYEYTGANNAACTDCRVVWENHVRSAAVPKLSTADNLIYTIERKNPLGGNATGIFDSYHFTVINPDSGRVLKQTRVDSGMLADTLQMAGNIGMNGVYWQGCIRGVLRIAPLY